MYQGTALATGDSTTGDSTAGDSTTGTAQYYRDSTAVTAMQETATLQRIALQGQHYRRQLGLGSALSVHSVHHYITCQHSDFAC